MIFFIDRSLICIPFISMHGIILNVHYFCKISEDVRIYLRFNFFNTSEKTISV